MTKDIVHFTESIFYSIEKIARYLEINGKDFFAQISKDISAEEFKTIDIIINNPDICQRDLAKIILRDRVRTGRILDSLEEKGLIKRFNDTKNNRLVKKMEMTELGKKYYAELTNKIQPYLAHLCEKFTPSQMNELKNLLDLLKNALSETVKVQV